MEDFAIIILVFGVMACIMFSLKMYKPDANRKQRKINVQDSAQKEVIESKDLTITTLKNELRSLNGKLTRFRDSEPELEEDTLKNGGRQVTWEEIQALVNQTYPQYGKMLPLVKKQIMDATEGMSMEQILTYVKQFTGNKQSEQRTPEITWDPNSA